MRTLNGERVQRSRYGVPLSVFGPFSLAQQGGDRPSFQRAASVPIPKFVRSLSLLSTNFGIVKDTSKPMYPVWFGSEVR